MLNLKLRKEATRQKKMVSVFRFGIFKLVSMTQRNTMLPEFNDIHKSEYGNCK